MLMVWALTYMQVLLPAFLVSARSAAPEVACLYQAALLMPTDIEIPGSSVCVLFVRMNASAIRQMERQVTAADAEEAARHASSLRATHERNMATVLSWSLLFLLSPEMAFRVDAVDAIFSLVEALGASPEGPLSSETTPTTAASPPPRNASGRDTAT